MNNVLHDWVFHYNTYTNKWEGATRDNYHNIFSSNKEGVIRSSRIETLINLIERTNGDIAKMNKLAKVK